MTSFHGYDTEEVANFARFIDEQMPNALKYKSFSVGEYYSREFDRNAFVDARKILNEYQETQPLKPFDVFCRDREKELTSDQWQQFGKWRHALSVYEVFIQMQMWAKWEIWEERMYPGEIEDAALEIYDFIKKQPLKDQISIWRGIKEDGYQSTETLFKETFGHYPEKEFEGYEFKDEEEANEKIGKYTSQICDALTLLSPYPEEMEKQMKYEQAL